MSEWAWVVLWCGVGLMTYALGFVGAVAIKTRRCRKAPRHEDCDHVWDGPEAVFWPLWIVVVVGSAPIWAPLMLIIRTSRRVEARIKENQRTKARAIAR